MQNIFESVTNVMKTFLDNEPKNPLHVGEVMNFWTYMTSLQEAIVYEEAGLNTTTDNDLKSLLEEAVRLCEGQAVKLKKFMQEEGIPLPDVSAAKPRSDPFSVPLGVKATDDELANGISIKIAAAIVVCAVGQSQSIRNDAGIIWLGFQADMVTFGATLKSLMRKRGWIKVPPYYYPPGIPKQ